MHRDKLSIWILVSSCFLLGVVLSATRAEGADPAKAAYSRDGSKLFWMLHISDTHLGSEWYPESERFEWFLTEVAPVIEPVLIVNTGDLCDGSISGIPTTGQSEAEWSLYRGLLDLADVDADYYLDLPGNHDGYGDPRFTHYLKWSLNGQATGKLTRDFTLSFPFGNYYIYGVSTPGDKGRVFIDEPGLSIEELTEIREGLFENDGADLIFVFGHHSLGVLDRSEIFVDALSEHEAFYFHGHNHHHSTYLHGDVFVGQVDSLGKGDTDNVAVIAVDNNAVTYVAVDNEDPWPLIVITAPAESKLSNGKMNPYYYEVCARGLENPVRALVFDEEEIQEVTYSVGEYGPYPMTRDPKTPHLWHGKWNTTGLSEGEVILEVTASGKNSRTETRSVMLADIPCPEPVPEPVDDSKRILDDAGAGDDGKADAGNDGRAEDTDSIRDQDWDTNTDWDGADAGIEPDAQNGDGSEEDGDVSCGCNLAGKSSGARQRGLKIIAVLQLFISAIIAGP